MPRVKDPFIASLDAFVLDIEIVCVTLIAVIVYYSRRTGVGDFAIGVFVGAIFGALVMHAILT